MLAEPRSMQENTDITNILSGHSTEDGHSTEGWIGNRLKLCLLYLFMLNSQEYKTQLSG